MQKTELDWKKSSNLTLPFKLSKHQLKTQVLFKLSLFRDKQILPPTGLTTFSMISNVWKETANLERKAFVSNMNGKGVHDHEAHSHPFNISLLFHSLLNTQNCDELVKSDN